MKVFRVLREENHEADMVAKLVGSEIMEMQMNILVEVVEAPRTEGMMVGTL